MTRIGRHDMTALEPANLCIRRRVGTHISDSTTCLLQAAGNIFFTLSFQKWCGKMVEQQREMYLLCRAVISGIRPGDDWQMT